MSNSLLLKARLSLLTGTKCKAKVIAKVSLQVLRYSCICLCTSDMPEMGERHRFFCHAHANSNLAQSVTAQLHPVLRLLQVTFKYELVSTENISPSWGYSFKRVFLGKKKLLSYFA